jgi:uncharacterized protein (DUF433 family)
VTELLAFTAEHVSQLTGLSNRQLGYWDRTGFFSPEYADKDRRRAFSRIYSFRDVVGLRTIAVLRNEHRVALQELRRVGAWLKKRQGTPWASLTFYVGGHRVYFDDPRTGARMGARPLGQPVLPVAMEEIAHEMRKAAAKLTERGKTEVGKVTQRRYLVHNAPVLAGTRIPTSAVWNFHDAGYSTKQIIREYPRLTSDDVEAAIALEQRRMQRRAG